MQSNNFMKDFVKNYQGLPLNIHCAGVGGTLALLTTIPGCSRVLARYQNIYNQDDLEEYLDIKFKSCVSQDVADNLCIRSWDARYATVGVTGALTTNRDRKGLNHAYITIDKKPLSERVETYYINLHKEPAYCENEERDEELDIFFRQRQDLLISQFILHILMDGKLKDFTDKDILELKEC